MLSVGKKSNIQDIEEKVAEMMEFTKNFEF